MNLKSRCEWSQMKAFSYRNCCSKRIFLKIIIFKDKFWPQKCISQNQAGIGKNGRSMTLSKNNIGLNSKTLYNSCPLKRITHFLIFFQILIANYCPEYLFLRKILWHSTLYIYKISHGSILTQFKKYRPTLDLIKMWLCFGRL